MHINLLRFKKLLTVFIIFVAVAAAYLALIRPATVFAQTSCSDACSSGQKRCSGSGYQTCGNYDSDYCYEWSGVYSCSTGYKCQNGSCVKSCSDACSSGSRRCSGSGYQTCVKGSSGCYVWSSVSNCSAGYKCQNGSCVKSCSDACSSGAKRCSSTSGYQTCVKGSGGCYVWSAPYSCSTGYKCQNGSCVRSCSDTCSSGARKCSGTSAYQTCVKNSQGCYAWSSATNCSTGYKCQNGSCVKSCSDACSSGAKKCSGTNTYQTCVKSSTGCYAWGSSTSCSTGYKCQNGSCVKSCSDTCSAGSKKCSGTTAYQTCVKGSSGCYAWSSASNCSTGYKCQNGSCVKSCSDACSSGSRRCSGSGYQTCVKGSSGCYVWSSVSNCSAGYKCSNGSCVKSCSDACTMGEKKCSGNSAYQTCVKSSQGCYIWGSAVNCAANYKCQNGSCVKSCSDICGAGEKRCVGTTSYQTCAMGLSGCYVWKSAVNCSFGYKCENGSCVKSCSDECASGEKQCSGDTSYQTCVKNSQGCYVWGSPKNCSTGYKCQNGSCVRSCSDECSSGAKQCFDDSSYQTCFKNSAGCYVWGTPKACATGYKCLNGSCVSSCSDECVSGEKECSDDDSYRVCGNYDSDKCTEWGTPKNCSFGYKCQNGSCVKSCSDECAPGQKECSTDTAYRICGKYDLDSCYEWSEDKECATGYNCQNGSCVKGCTDQCTSGDHQCSGTSGRTCGNYDSDSCTEWSGYEKCDDQCFYCGDGKCNSDCGETKNTCSEDCGASCTDQCTSGDHQCSGTSGRTCGNYDSDSCTEWSGYEKCDDQCFYCGDGKCNSDCGETKNTCSEDCGASCTDQCTSGDHQCSGTSGRTCGNYDSDSCTEWSGYEKCDDQCFYCGDGKCNSDCGETKNTCSEDCGASCTDQCTSGDHQCSGTSGRTCGNYDSDSCTEWSGYEKCDDQCFYCGDGKCNSDCGETKNTCSEDCGADKPTVELTGPASVSCKGSATISWTSTKADTCTASGGWSGTKDTSGSETIDGIIAKKTFSLACTGPGGKASDSITVSVDIVSPQANAGGDKQVDENDETGLDGSGSAAGYDSDDLVYVWTCNGGSLDNADTAQPTFNAQEVSRDTVYTCTLKVTNNCNKTDSDTVNVVVKNKIAGQFAVDLSASPDSGCAPLNNVDLTARIVDIEGDKDSKYTYYFSCEGDGEWDKTITTSATSYTAKDLCDYGDEGEYQSEVKVEGSESGEEATDSVMVEVDDCGREFTVRLEVEPSSGCKPVNNVDLTAAITDDSNRDSDDYTYRFDCDDDGEWEKTITTSSDRYTAKDLCDYDSTGTHTAKVIVEAGEGEATDKADVNVKSCGGKEFNVNLTASPDSGCAPLDNVDLTAHITGYDNDGDIEYTYYFDCDDDDDWDKKMTTEDTSYTARNLCDYDDADDYTARVKVESNGQFDEDTVKINTDDCENGEGDLKVEKTVSNLSRGAGYLDSVNARPGDFVSFKISIEAVSDNVENLTLSDVLPDGLIDIRDIEIDGRPNRGDIENGLDLDDLNEGDEVVVTFIATVDNASSFHYGQTTITNTVTARGEGASDSDEADIIVQRAEIAGITAISTGFTDNPFLDSFVIPLGLSLFGVWALKAKLLAIEEFLDAWKIAFAKFHSQKSLAAKISQLKIKHIATRFK